METKHVVIICVVLVVVVGLPLGYSAFSRPSTPDIPPEVRAYAAMAANVQQAQAQAQEAIKDIRVTVHEKGPWQCDNPFLQPKPGNVYYALDLTVANDGSALPSASSFAFRLRDSQGREYQHCIAHRDPALPSRDIPQNDEVRGWLTFEIPESMKPTALVYEPFPGFTSPAIVTELP